MASNFKPSPPSQDWVEGENFANAEEAVDALLRLPNLRCPVCSSEIFEMLEDFEKNLRTALNRYKFPAPESRTFEALVSLACDNCGYVMSFTEDKLKSKMSRRG